MAVEYPIIDWRPVQERLQQLGFYTGLIDGKRGSLTDSAIVAFKRSIGFAPRPLYGPLTHEALLKRPPAQSVYPWLVEAERVLGLHERRDTATLRAWFDKSFAWVDPREVAWCGAFVGTCLRKWQPDRALPGNAVGARQWAAWGGRCLPQRGAVAVFWRGSREGWQGHVGFIAAEDRDAFHVLGGNQSDAVTITRIAKSRLLETRWPEGFPEANQIRVVDARGNLSTNEA